MGDAIALEGTAGSDNVQGPARASLPKSVYLFRPPDDRFIPFVANLPDSALPAWPPDAHWIATVTTVNETRGLWMSEASSGKRTLILADMYLGTASYSPDGTSIAVDTADMSADKSAIQGRVGLGETS